MKDRMTNGLMYEGRMDEWMKEMARRCIYAIEVALYPKGSPMECICFVYA